MKVVKAHHRTMLRTSELIELVSISSAKSKKGVAVNEQLVVHWTIVKGSNDWHVSIHEVKVVRVFILIIFNGDPRALELLLVPHL